MLSIQFIILSIIAFGYKFADAYTEAEVSLTLSVYLRTQRLIKRYSMLSLMERYALIPYSPYLSTSLNT